MGRGAQAAALAEAWDQRGGSVPGSAQRAGREEAPGPLLASEASQNWALQGGGSGC